MASKAKMTDAELETVRDEAHKEAALYVRKLLEGHEGSEAHVSESTLLTMLAVAYEMGATRIGRRG